MLEDLRGHLPGATEVVADLSRCVEEYEFDAALSQMSMLEQVLNERVEQQEDSPDRG